jgi:hypothetical protein
MTCQNMTRKLVATCACLLLAITALALVGHRLYEHHLTEPVKKLLVAALDPHISDLDAMEYVREARLLVETRMDREMLEKYEDASATVRYAKARFSEAHAVLNDPPGGQCGRDLAEYTRQLNFWADTRTPPPQGWREKSARLVQEFKLCRLNAGIELDERTDGMEALTKRLDDAHVILNEIRVQLGRPARLEPECSW